MSITDQRAAAVAATIETARGIVARMGVTRAALDQLKSTLIALGERAELFPPEHFRIPAGRANAIFHLAEDADGSFALYGSAGLPGAKQLPHDHTTWAVIAGIYGDEHNVFYRRSDDGAVAGRGALEQTGEITVRKGTACALMPDDFHTIETRGAGPKLHLHLYGRTLEDLPGRIGFESDAGGAYRRFMAKPEIVSPLVTAPELRAMLGDGAELALLDVREEGVFSNAHLLTAASLPLSRLEMRVDAMVPRRATRIVLCDDDEMLAQRAAAVLRRFGYRHISVLAGGVGAWKAAGFELFSGVYVPSKAFGEFVEHECGTPRIGAAELKARLDAGEDVVILDSRPMDEYRVMNIPGAADCPGAELVYRVHEVVQRPETLVVVNCAGRTRSIIGAQSLINAGIPNKVMALKNGTMGWHLAGLSLEHGSTRHAPAPGETALAKARAAAARVADRFGVKRIGVAELDQHASGHLADALLLRRAQPGRIPRGSSRRVRERAGRSARAGDRRLCRRPQRPHRPRGCGWRARDHDRFLAPADGVARGVRARPCRACGGARFGHRRAARPGIGRCEARGDRRDSAAEVVVRR